MKTQVLAAIALSVGLSSTGLGGGSAAAQPPPSDYRWYGGPDNRDWDAAQHYDGGRNYHHQDHPITRDDYIYRGHDGRYYCRRPDGTTGLVVGAIGGALIGNAIGGDTLGTLLGGAGGAALGRSIERNQVHCR